MPETPDSALTLKLLKELPKIELDTISDTPLDRLRFEYSLLQAAGLTAKSEVELIRDLVGPEAWKQTEESTHKQADGRS